MTVADHLEKAGREPPPIDVPEQGEHLLEWFFALDAARSSNGMGANPIGYGELDAWSRLTGAEPSPQEVVILKRMDTAYLNELNKANK